MKENCCEMGECIRFDIDGIHLWAKDLNFILNELDLLIKQRTTKTDQERLWIQEALKFSNDIFKCSDSLLHTLMHKDKENN